MNDNIMVVSMLCCMLFALGVCIWIVVGSSNSADNFTDQLQTSNIKVINGYIDSSSVRIPVSEYSFMQKASEIGTVYRDELSFYVFINQEQTIVWQYNPPI